MDIQGKIKSFIIKNKEILFLIILATAARLVFLGLRPFDSDEGVVLKIAQQKDIASLLSGVARDVHPPLLHLFEYMALNTLKVSEFSARLPIALVSIVGIIFVYLYFLKISNKKTAFLTALLSIFSATIAYHAADTRADTILFTAFFIQLYCFENFREKYSWKYLVALILSTLLLLMSQYIGFLIIFAESLFVIYQLIRRRFVSGKKRTLLSVLFAFLVSTILFCGIWGNVFLRQLGGRFSEKTEISSKGDALIGMINAAYRFSMGRLFLDLDLSISKNIAFLKSNPLIFLVFFLSLITSIYILILGLRIFFKNGYQKKIYYIFFIIAFLIVAGLISTEIGVRSSRYFQFLVPFCTFLIALCLINAKKIRSQVMVIIFLVLYLSSFLNTIYFERIKPGADEIAKHITVNGNKGDLVLSVGGFGGNDFVLKYYLRDIDDEIDVVDLYSRYSVGNYYEIIQQNPFLYIRDFLNKNTGSAVWLVSPDYSLDFSALDTAEILVDSKISHTVFDLGKDKENKIIFLGKLYYENNSF